MARVLTCGWESNSISESVGGAITGAGWTVNSSVPYAGNYCVQGSTSAGSVNELLPFTTGATLGRKILATFRFRFPALPAAPVALANWGIAFNNSSLIRLILNANGTVSGVNTTTVGTSAVLATATWHTAQMSVTIGTGSVDTLEFIINGVTLYSATGLNISDTLFSHFILQATGTDVNFLVQFDDLKINDDSGASETGYPGTGKLVLLLPTADSAVGSGWTGGAGGASNLWDAVNNEPPTGAADPGTNASQIRNATSASTTYTATLQSYTVAGVPAGSTINGVQAIAVTGAPVVTSAKTGSVGIASNPVVANLSFGNFYSGVNAAAFPTGWKYVLGTYSVAPSVTQGTAPTVSLTLTGGTTTRIADCCLLGLYADFTPLEVTESASATDASDGPLGSAVTEAGAATDSAQGVLPGNSGSVTEAGAATDASSEAMAATAAIAEAGAAADSPSSIAVVARVEAGAAGDAPSALTLNAVAEAGAASDAESIATTMTASLTEAATASDSESVIAQVSVFEILFATDGPSVSATFTAAQAEAGAAADSPSSIVLKSITEAGAAADSESVLMSASVSQAEAGAAGETESVLTVNAQAESAAAADASALAVTMSAALTEAGAATTTQTLAAQQAVASEAGAANDASSAVMNPAASITEAGAATESSSSVNGLLKSITEAGAAGDSSSVSAVASAAQAEAGVAGDAQAGSLSAPVSVTEAGAGADAQSTLMSAPVSQAEAGAAGSAQAVTATASPSLIEAGAAGDAQSSAATFSPSVSEAGAAIESESGAMVASPTATEAGAALDISSGVIPAVVASIEEAAAADSQAFATMSLARLEAAAATDSLAASVLASRQLAEVAVAVALQSASFVAQVLQEEGAGALDAALAVMESTATILEAALALAYSDAVADRQWVPVPLKERFVAEVMVRAVLDPLPARRVNIEDVRTVAFDTRAVSLVWIQPKPDDVGGSVPLYKYPGDSTMFDFDCTNLLAPGETITAPPVMSAQPTFVPEDSHLGNLVFGPPVVNVAPITYPDGRVMAVGKGFQVRISAGLEYTERESCEYSVMGVFTTSAGNTLTTKAALFVLPPFGN